MEPKFHADWSKKRRDRGLCSNVLNSIFQCKSSKPHEQPKQQWCGTAWILPYPTLEMTSPLHTQALAASFLTVGGRGGATAALPPRSPRLNFSPVHNLLSFGGLRALVESYNPGSEKSKKQNYEWFMKDGCNTLELPGACQACVSNCLLFKGNWILTRSFSVICS